MTVNNKATGADQALALPEWSDCEFAVDEKTATPLQRFIYEYEPGDNDEEWRQRLTAALAQARKSQLEADAKVLCGFCERGNPVQFIPEADGFKHQLEGETPWATCYANNIRKAAKQER